MQLIIPTKELFNKGLPFIIGDKYITDWEWIICPIVHNNVPLEWMEFSNNYEDELFRISMGYPSWIGTTKYELIDYFEDETNKLNNAICKCDFYSVILITGCKCGGK